MKTSGMGGARLEKLDTLTSLRFFAAAMIVIGHGFPYFQVPSFAQQFPLGQGVSFFFVLSGFVLSYAYPKFSTLKDVLRFLWARFARIWPAHIASLLLMLCIVPSVLWYVSPSHPYWYSIANLLMVHSWIPFRESYLGLNGVSWSISTEFFFYLCFPFLVYQWQKTWPVKIVLVVSLLICIILMSNIFQLPPSSSYSGVGIHALIYVSPISRLFEFTLGIIACGLFHSMKYQANKLSFSGASIIEFFIVSLVVIVMWATKQLAINNNLALLIGNAGIAWFKSSGSSIIFSIFIIIFAFQRGILSNILRYPIFVLLGEVSFSLYLVHTIVLKYFDSHNLFLKNWSYLFYWIFSILFSYLIFRTIEMPCRSYLLKLTKRNAEKEPNKFSKINFLSLLKTKTFFLFCMLIFLVIFARQLEFSTLNTINKNQLNEIFETKNILKSNADFNNGLSLVHLSILEESDNTIKFDFIWCAAEKIILNQHVGFHFLNAQKKIIRQADFLLDKNHTEVEPNTCFIVNSINPSLVPLDTKFLGVALYVTSEKLIKVKGKLIDWDSSRLLIPVDNGKY